MLPYFEQINKIKTKEDIANFLISSEPILNSSFFGIGIDSDMKNSDENITYLSPAGFGLPERDFYTSNEEDAIKIRTQYKEHIGKMLHFLGKTKHQIDNAKKHIFVIESKLAHAKITKEASRNPENVYHKMTLDSLSMLMPNFPIKKYFKKLNIDIKELVISQPKYIQVFDTLFNNEDIESIKDYLTWNIFRGAADNLSIEISDANWEFYGKTLNGQIERKALKERALSTVNWSIGEAVGKLYVAKMFPPKAKASAKEMINNLQKAYVQRINNLTWMSAETKVKAINKVNSLQIKIAYPDKWKDYSELQIVSPKKGGTFFSNYLNYARWSFKEQVNKLSKPVDKTEWGMAPQIVNAYYNPSYNEIVFPAAILQPPFYDYNADEAVNYGGMGSVIGHEISHGFDDQGAKFNAKGNFENWWTKKDSEEFGKLVKKLADQYDKIEVLPNVFVNGDYTSGENIGDLGGVNAAYTALQLYYKNNKKPSKIQGYTPEQRFFMSWATVWRTKSREEALKQQIKTDVHSPGQVRAEQSLKNIDEFYKAFDVKEGDGMYLDPKSRVKIW